MVKSSRKLVDSLKLTLFFFLFFTALAVMLFGIFSSSASAENRFRRQLSSSSCGHHVQAIQQEYHYPVQQIVREEVYYFVGQPLRIQALIEKESQDNDYAEFKAWQRQKQQKYTQQQNIEQDTNTCPSCSKGNENSRRRKTPSNPPTQTPESPTTNDGLAGPATSDSEPINPPPHLPPRIIPNPNNLLFIAKCAGCHSGAAPKGQLGLEEDNTITGKQYKKIIEAIETEKMPKGGPPLTKVEQDQIKSELLSLLQD